MANPSPNHMPEAMAYFPESRRILQLERQLWVPEFQSNDLFIWQQVHPALQWIHPDGAVMVGQQGFRARPRLVGRILEDTVVVKRLAADVASVTYELSAFREDAPSLPAHRSLHCSIWAKDKDYWRLSMHYESVPREMGIGSAPAGQGSSTEELSLRK